MNNTNVDLDYKVMGRGSVFLLDDEQSLSGFFKKAFKKIKKIGLAPLKLTKKLAIDIPIKVTKKSIKIIGKIDGKLLKKIGAVTAIGVATYFGGPAVLGVVGSMGGSKLATAASSIGSQNMIGDLIKTGVSFAQQKSLSKKAKKLSAAQLLADPEMMAMSQQLAQIQALQQFPNQNKIGVQALAREGATEIQHQAAKIAGVSTVDLLKIGIPASIGIVALLMR